MRTCPTDALDVLLHILPIDLHIKFTVACSIVRLEEAGFWTSRPFGHCNTVELRPNELASISTDYQTPELNFHKNFKVMFPSRSEWKRNEVLKDYDTVIFTDGSKMDCGVGSGVFSHQLNVSLSLRLPDFSSVFQAEIIAIREAAKMLMRETAPRNNIAICSDSQAALKALQSHVTTSKQVKQCKEALAGIDQQQNVCLIWVPGHSDIEGNEKADELARRGSALRSGPMEGVNFPLKSVKGGLFSHYLKKANNRWESLTSCSVSRKTWPNYNTAKTNELLNNTRNNIARIVSISTGHWPIGDHAARLKIPHNEYCRSCRDVEERETLTHFLCNCPALARTRQQTLGIPFPDSLETIGKIQIRELIRFLNSSGWI